MLAALRNGDLGWRADGHALHTNSLSDAADGDAGWPDSIPHTADRDASGANRVSNATNGDTTCDDRDSGTSKHNSEYRSVRSNCKRGQHNLEHYAEYRHKYNQRGQHGSDIVHESDNQRFLKHIDHIAKQHEQYHHDRYSDGDHFDELYAWKIDGTSLPGSRSAHNAAGKR